MKNKILLIALTTFSFLVSCKNEKEAEKIENETVKVKKNEYFTVEMDVIASKEDNFSVYYTEDGTINFTGERAVWSGVLAQEASQKITFKLPEEVIPTHIRFDLGLNKEQGDIIIEKFKFDFYGNSFEAKGSEFLKYFITNDQVKTEIDEAKGTIKFLKNPNGFVAPFYYPHQALLDEIAKITK
jgi:hypothetical protein